MRASRLFLPMLALGLAACVSSPDSTSASSNRMSVARGQAAAYRLCASCHAVDRFGQSAHSDAPPFRSLSDIYPVAALADALVAGLMTGNPDMPEARLTTEEAKDFVAYLEDIQQPGIRRVEPGSWPTGAIHRTPGS